MPTPTIPELRAMNLNSIDVMTKALQRLKELRPQAAPNPMLEDHIAAEISSLELEIRLATIVQTRLQAAQVTVKPLSRTKADKLQKLASTIDETIERDAVITASLGTVTKVIETAKQIRDQVKAATVVPG